jgi:hypothetical protein
MIKSLIELSLEASCKILLFLAKWFQRRRFLETDQQEKRIAYGGHVFKQIETKLAIFIEDLPLVLPIRFRFIRSQNDDMFVLVI